MKLLALLLFVCVGTASSIFGQASPDSLTLDQIAKLDATERVRFYQMLQPKNLSNPSEFVPALVAGIEDPDLAVRVAASAKAAYAMIGLQQIKQQGQPMPVNVTDVQSLQATLIKALNDTSSEVRGPAMTALIYTDAPNQTVGQALSASLSQEPDKRLRVSVAKDMALAGYTVPIVESTLIAGLDDPDRKVREHAAKAIAVVKPDGALSKLALRLGDQEMMRDFVVDAIAAYGPAAANLLPTLEKMLADPSIGGTLPDRIRAAIVAIKNPPPQAAVAAQIKPVSLVDSSLPTASATATPVPPVATSVQQPESAPPATPLPTVAETQSSRGFPIVPVAIIGVVIVGIAIFVLRRKSK